MSDGGSSAQIAATSNYSLMPEYSGPAAISPASSSFFSSAPSPASTTYNWMGAAGFGVQAASGFAGAFAQSRALQSQGRYQAQMYDFNRQIGELQAKDATDRGDLAVIREKEQIAGVIGEERAGLAGQGVQVDSGSAAEIQENTRNISATNVLTIKNNAWREAWGFKTQATNSGYQGQFAQMSADNMATNTLLTGGLNAVSDIGKGIGTYSGSYRVNGSNANPGMRY